MSEKTHTINDLRRLIQPVAARYGVERVLLFGSHARGDAKPGSDIDLRIDSGAIHGYFKLAGFHRELEEALVSSVDILTTGSLGEDFLSQIAKEEVILYEQPRQ